MTNSDETSSFLNTSRSGSYRLIQLPKIQDRRGDLTFIEAERHVPFDIRRVYYLYNVPVDSYRGAHAHRTLQQVIFALSGSFRVKVDNGTSSDEFLLRNPQQGLYIKNLVWSEID